MSVTFSLAAADSRSINLANLNAIDLLRWLGIGVESEADLVGEMRATEIAARCRRRLWDEARNYDPALPESVVAVPGRPVIISCGRREGYLRERTEELLAISESAAPGDVVRWS